MRLIEILILLADLAYLFYQLFPGLRRFRALSYTPTLASLFMLAHLLIEKPRWQMVPLYFLTALFLLVMIATVNRPAPWKWTGKMGAILGLLIAALLPALLPVPSLPAPTGPYRVGTSVFYWTDEARGEAYTADPNDYRRIMVQVWYPAQPQPGVQPGAKREPYLRDLDRLYPAIAKAMHMLPFTYSHLALAATNAYTNAPVAPAGGRFPVLVFSHGWTGFRSQNDYDMEFLASHGYVVFAADHTYGAAAVAFPNGEIIPYNPNALPKNVPDPVYDQAARVLGQSFVGDIRFVLDQAARLDAGAVPSPLSGRLDLERVGIFGHSTGGGAAVETCWIDPRCKAGLAMDAWLIPYSRDMVTKGLERPFLFMHSQSWTARRNPPLVDTLFANMHADAFQVRLDGTNHYSFTDIELFMPFLSRLQSGSLFRRSPMMLAGDYTLAFFDQYLKDQPSDLLARSPKTLAGARLEQK